MTMDERPQASGDHFVWSGDRDQAGCFIHGYQSAWLPSALLDAGSGTSWSTPCAAPPGSGMSSCTSTRRWAAGSRPRAKPRATRR
jgi:hypothetical protein